MKRHASRQLDQYRIKTGSYGTDSSYGNTGAFLVPYPGNPASTLRVISSDGSDWQECGMPLPVWEHVSVSLSDRCPTWQEMDFVKRLFWSDDETVVQFHVPRSRHINCHDFCLHLWKPVGLEFPMPPSQCVGPSNGKVKR